jgi:RNA polymerase sigma factor (sigma-70 family)
MAESEELDLERRFIEDPEGHLRMVYERYSGILFRFLYRFTENRQVAEEILHDLFLELVKGRFRPLDGGTLKSWLFTVAKNRALNQRRTNKRFVAIDERSPFTIC